MVHPYEKKVIKLRHEKCVHPNNHFEILIYDATDYGTTLATVLIFQLALLQNSKIWL